ncbi:MAG TPA: NADH-quinone oxidoreductase subunit L [Gammaproteobacteria bacterium]|nr:NADH-quinone oxidoreductase subunit L [Gammaproteobacteria bacterium]
MADYVFLIPLMPLIGFLLLVGTLGKLPRLWVGLIGAGSIAIAFMLVVLTGLEYLGQADPTPYTVDIYTWMQLAGFTANVSFLIDGLSLTMLSVITGVGFLIHVYSALFMWQDKDYSRFFSYMNLFVAAMLLLVLADNLLVLFVGWEGVGLCSYLLVGFWHEENANGAAARKAFVVTRVGDTAMALGMFLLFVHLGTLDIQAMAAQATQIWQPGDLIVTIACLLLVGGAVGKSAQLPLQTWLPDAMAGPTPVSALIHAATMVTAGVYLIARTHELFLLAPAALLTVAVIGAITLLMAAFAAMAQTDIKRILAYSTISQIGYMFLALGVGAWSSAIFHLMTHAFFKALLFLAAGAVIYSLHHEHNIFRMGGLRKKLPVAFWSFVIGSAALAALPLTSGFYSKDLILLATYHHNAFGGWLLAAGMLGALLTAIYSFRLVFIVFFGEVKTQPDAAAGKLMSIPLMILSLLAIIGGWFTVPVESVFPVAAESDHTGLMPMIIAGVPILGVLLAYLIYLKPVIPISLFTQSALGKQLIAFWYSHWAMDWIYDRLLVKPYCAVAAINRKDIIDWFYNAVADVLRSAHQYSTISQSGQLRTYVAVIAAGLVLTLAVFLGILIP